jgi:uncharacterized protein YfaS (alpha-2-macroglobulin family)
MKAYSILLVLPRQIFRSNILVENIRFLSKPGIFTSISLHSSKDKFAGIITIGGDDAYNPDALAEVNRFKSFVNHQGPFKLAKNGKNTHTITIPNFVGKLRLMVVACNERNFGHLEKYIPVKKPIDGTDSISKNT